MFRFVQLNVHRTLTLAAILLAGAILPNLVSAAESGFIAKPFTSQEVSFSFGPSDLQITGNGVTGTGSIEIVASAQSMSQGEFSIGNLSGYSITAGNLTFPTVTSLSTDIGGVGVYSFSFYIQVDPGAEFGLIGDVGTTVNGTDYLIPINTPTFSTPGGATGPQLFIYSLPVVI